MDQRATATGFAPLRDPLSPADEARRLPRRARSLRHRLRAPADAALPRPPRAGRSVRGAARDRLSVRPRRGDLRGAHAVLCADRRGDRRRGSDDAESAFADIADAFRDAIARHLTVSQLIDLRDRHDGHRSASTTRRRTASARCGISSTCAPSRSSTTRRVGGSVRQFVDEIDAAPRASRRSRAVAARRRRRTRVRILTVHAAKGWSSTPSSFPTSPSRSKDAGALHHRRAASLLVMRGQHGNAQRAQRRERDRQRARGGGDAAAVLRRGDAREVRRRVRLQHEPFAKMGFFELPHRCVRVRDGRLPRCGRNGGSAKYDRRHHPSRSRRCRVQSAATRASAGVSRSGAGVGARERRDIVPLALVTPAAIESCRIGGAVATARRGILQHRALGCSPPRRSKVVGRGAPRSSGDVRRREQARDNACMPASASIAIVRPFKRIASRGDDRPRAAAAHRRKRRARRAPHRPPDPREGSRRRDRLQERRTDEARSSDDAAGRGVLRRGRADDRAGLRAAGSGTVDVGRGSIDV